MSVKTRRSAAGRSRGRSRAGGLGWFGTWYLRLAAIALAAVVGLVSAVLFGGSGTADRFAEFEAALFHAQRPFLKHFDPGADTNLLEAHGAFAEGGLSPDELDALAATWGADFTAARDAVRELDPNTPIDPPPTPEELVQASWFIAESIEAWRGVVALYPRAADLRRAVGDAAGPLRTRLDEQLDELLVQIREWHLRAANLHELGARQVDNRRRDLRLEGGPQLRPAPPQRDQAGEQP